MMASLSDLRRRYHPELESIMASHFQQMKDHLPPEKSKKLEAVRDRLRRWGHKPGPPRPPRRFGAERIISLLRQELGLSPEQMLQVRSLFRERFSNTVPAASLDRRPSWPELETELRPILTQDQMAAFKKLAAESRLRPSE
jgi:hypothetical protein